MKKKLHLPKSAPLALLLAAALVLTPGCGAPDEQTQAVIDSISAIGEVTLEQEDAIDEAQAAYDALDDEQKEQVENYDELTAAQDSLSELKIASVEELIAAIGEVTLDKEDAITAAHDAYNELTGEQKLDLEGADSLTQAEKTLKSLKEAAEKAELVATIEGSLLEQAVYCTGATKDVQNSAYKNLYPDMLHIDGVTNNSGKVVRDVEISFAAWDENGYPVRPNLQFGAELSTNVVTCSASDVNIESGSTWTVGRQGWPLASPACDNVVNVRAIVAEVTFTDGTVWTNPKLNDWYSVYQDQDLPS